MGDQCLAKALLVWTSRCWKTKKVRLPFAHEDFSAAAFMSDFIQGVGSGKDRAR
jgi:hypothetical protein